MELKVGMYIRTEDGYIFKIEELLETGKYNDSDNKVVQRFRVDGTYKKNDDYIESDCIYSDWIIKASHNIINLIEVGDYVNGERVQYKTYSEQLISDGEYDILKKYQDIKTIVTKEQFESMKYEVK